jgi:hypothetical protein
MSFWSPIRQRRQIRAFLRRRSKPLIESTELVPYACASIMDKTQKPLDEKFRLKKPVKIQYASPEEVSVATSQVLKEHWLAFDLLAKS